MTLQSSKNGPNFVCEKGTFSQIWSHIPLQLEVLSHQNLFANWMCVEVRPLLQIYIIIRMHDNACVYSMYKLS